MTPKPETPAALVAAALGCTIMLAATAPATAATPLETPQAMLADKIRGQGFECQEPVSAQRDEKLSKPHDVVWTLTCKNATYRLHVVPDMAAKVETLKPDEKR